MKGISISERALRSGIVPVSLLRRGGMPAAFHFYFYTGMYEVR